CLLSFFRLSVLLPDLHSFPTRRSSDLSRVVTRLGLVLVSPRRHPAVRSTRPRTFLHARRRNRAPARRAHTRRDDHALGRDRRQQDRKSTRLNSSHLVISYAVFCLKKKK